MSQDRSPFRILTVMDQTYLTSRWNVLAAAAAAVVVVVVVVRLRRYPGAEAAAAAPALRGNIRGPSCRSRVDRH
jgi:hypothetical protein